jgi:two-component system sensor histidine kinase/response regulator
MPEMDGFEVMAVLRKREEGRPEHLPVIGMTAMSRPNDRDRCLSAEMDSYLAKPVRPRDFYAAIQQVFRRIAPPAAPAGKDGASQSQQIVDAATLLASCGENPQLLRKMIASFETHAMRQLEEVGQAISAGDAEALAERAHKLVGLVSAFSTVCAREVARLEEMGLNSDLAGAAEQYRIAREAMERLVPLLQGLEIDKLRGD